jgi:transposase
MSKQFSSDLKLQTIKYYYKVNNYSKVCDIFECSERSLKIWIERYEKYDTVDRIPRKEGSYKIKKEYIKFIKETIKNNNDIHIKVLFLLLKNKFPDLDKYNLLLFY